MSNRSFKVQTRIPGLDQITGGGLPKSSAIALIGNVGGGKEMLVKQILWNLLSKGIKFLYYSVSQSADELRYDMLSYKWDTQPFTEDGSLRIVDLFSHGANRMEKEFRKDDFDEKSLSEIDFHKSMFDSKLIYKEGMAFSSPIVAARDPTHRIVIFDSLSPFFSTNIQGTFQMMHVMKFATRLTKATGIGIMHTGIHERKIEETFKSLADGIIEVNRHGETASCFITIPKYPGEHDRGPFPLEIEKDGVHILPILMPDLM